MQANATLPRRPSTRYKRAISRPTHLISTVNAMSAPPDAPHQDLFPLGPDTTAYRKLTSDGVRVETLGSRAFVSVARLHSTPHER